MIDDSDSNVQYQGQWFYRNGVTESISGNGSPYLETQHGIIENGSVSYTFNGTSIFAIGAAYNISEPTFPSWQCFLDGREIGNGTSFELLQARKHLCHADSLDPHLPHTISVNVTGNPNQAFLFDFFRCEPLLHNSLDNAVIRVDSGDPSLKYGKGWFNVPEKYQPASGKFNDGNASVSFNFEGSSLSWWGYTLNNSTLGISLGLADYSIDGAPPVTFQIPSPPTPSSLTQANEKYFDTGPLQYDIHELVVKYNKESEANMPISLSYLLIKNGNASASAPSISPSTSSVSAPAESDQFPTKHTNALGYIIGGVLGGLAILSLIFAAIIIYLRRRRRVARTETARKTFFWQRPNVEEHANAQGASSIHTENIRSISTVLTPLTLTEVTFSEGPSTQRTYSYSRRPSVAATSSSSVRVAERRMSPIPASRPTSYGSPSMVSNVNIQPSALSRDGRSNTMDSMYTSR
ncbi:hypothetical protein D9613_010000 [Agrocybe pediades]|uniref:Uncharacterized protein n=1 Tax=Agrocybe pediades TaxID=84607 RepID=A0A8H4VPY6_9AGAR|nr:hypothetical protein D9613_010000 [Agrocybe pediades]